jgi:hypothetical protein
MDQQPATLGEILPRATRALTRLEAAIRGARAESPGVGDAAHACADGMYGIFERLRDIRDAALAELRWHGGGPTFDALRAHNGAAERSA